MKQPTPTCAHVSPVTMTPLLEDMIGIAACVSAPTKVDLFWLQADRGLYHQPGDATQWSSDWEDLGGTFITVPAAVATNSAQLGFPELLDVFAVGADFAMYTKQFAQGGWPAQWLSPRGDFNSGPAVIGAPMAVWTSSRSAATTPCITGLAPACRPTNDGRPTGSI